MILRFIGHVLGSIISISTVLVIVTLIINPALIPLAVLVGLPLLAILGSGPIQLIEKLQGRR